MKQKIALLIMIVVVLTVFFPTTAYAQEDGDSLQLSLTRNFGYGGLGKIQGNFTLKIVNPPAEVDLVEFYLDGKLITMIESEPFSYKFHTSEFSEGEHKMSAIGYLDNGETIESNRITKVFLSSDQAWGETQNIIFPLLVGTAALSLLGLGIPLLFTRNREFVLGKYGPTGGAVCPRCKLPFSRLFLSPNLLVGKLVRCPHCGKISVLPQASQAKLQEAEARFKGKDMSTVLPAKSSDLKMLIDDSRFED